MSSVVTVVYQQEGIKAEAKIKLFIYLLLSNKAKKNWLKKKLNHAQEKTVHTNTATVTWP